MMSARARSQLRVSAPGLQLPVAAVTAYSDLCAALLLRSRLCRAQKCRSAIGVTGYGTSAAVVASGTALLCSAALAA